VDPQSPDRRVSKTSYDETKTRDLTIEHRRISCTLDGRPSTRKRSLAKWCVTPGNSGSSAVLSAFMAAWLRCQGDGAGTAPSGIACAIAGWPNSIELRSSPLSQSDRKRIRLLGRGWPCRSGARRRTGRCCGSTRSPPPPFAVRRVIESTAEVRWYRKGRRSVATWRHTSMALLRSFLT
jgi:hypothetical protein